MIKKLLLNLYIWPLFFVVTLVAMLLIPFLWLGNSITLRVPVGRAFRLGIRKYGLILVRWIPFFAPVQFQDRSGGTPEVGIYVANHNSSVDPYCYGVLPGEYAFLTSWPFSIPFYRWAMNKAQYLNAAWDWNTLLAKSFQLLENGCSLIIWPEGHRSRDGALGKFKNGAFRLSCETGHPVIPVCIKGTHRLMPPGSRLLTPSRVSVTILPPQYPPKDLSGRIASQKLSAKVRETLLRELATE